MNEMKIKKIRFTMDAEKCRGTARINEQHTITRTGMLNRLSWAGFEFSCLCGWADHAYERSNKPAEQHRLKTLGIVPWYFEKSHLRNCPCNICKKIEC